MDFIEEKAKSVPVYGEYDVVVAGGGVAGIAAALAAVRHGAKTLLIEKQFALGGLATLGLVTIYLPLCDGCGRQVSFGLAEELLKLSIDHGCEGRYPAAWIDGGSDDEKCKNRYMVEFNAQMFAIRAEQQLLAEGVEILYGTSVCAAAVNDKKVDALFIENKSGRSAVKLKSAVDATGDADIFAFADAKTVNFTQGNILAAWYYSNDDGKYTLHPIGCCDVPDKEKNERNSPQLLASRRFTGLCGKELSEMVEMSHSNILEHFSRGGKLSPGHMLATIATIPQVRMTRRPDGMFALDDTDDHKRFDDSIGLISNWKKSGPIYEIPFRCLYSKDLKNVAAAGRCISNTDAMWDISRVIPCCAVTGQAAGTAAAMSDDFHSLSVEKLQKTLENDGVVLHI